MRVCLLYNETAGDGTARDELRSLLEEHGHEIIHIVAKDEDLGQALENSIELVVAAGGDGTVSRAASALAGRNLPFAVLPLGTANNIARSLGIEGTLSEMVARWNRARRTPLDLGVLHGSWGETRFIESVGAGLIASGIAGMEVEAGQEDESTDVKIERALRTYLDVLERMKCRQWKLTVDGKPMGNEFLLIEALNVRSVGPNIRLTRQVHPSDGKLSLVTACEEHRGELVAYLETRIAGHEAHLRLPTRLATEIEIEGLHEIHVDDRVRHWPSMGTISIGIEPAAVDVLL